MSEPFLGQITMFGGNFAPAGWSYCSGQLLSIAQNSALFSILGTTYGGDGETTFGLPEMRGRVAVHSGGNSAGPGLTARPLGQRSGTQTNTLTTGNLPAHNHPVRATDGSANGTDPNGLVFATAEDADRNPLTLYSNATPNVTMASDSTANTGGGIAVNNMQPYLVVNFIIAIQGTFPSQN